MRRLVAISWYFFKPTQQVKGNNALLAKNINILAGVAESSG